MSRLVKAESLSKLSMAGTMSVIEHVVLFKVKQDAPEEKKVAMVRELNALRSLDGVLHLKAGPALHLWPSHKSFTAGFTHILHSRYADKAGLAAYAAHPSHVSVVEKFVKPIAEDLLAMDWEAELEGPVDEDGQFAKRLVACKVKDDQTGDVRQRMSSGNGGGKMKTSSGLNFSPGRSKGFNFGFLALFPSVEELQEFGNPEKMVASVEGNSSVEGLIVLDFANLDEQAEISSAKM